MVTVVKEDGSYGTEVIQQSHEQAVNRSASSILRKLLTSDQPDSLLAGVVAVATTKLLLKMKDLDPKGVLLLCSLAKILDTRNMAMKDSKERVLFCLKLVGLARKDPSSKSKALKKIEALFTDADLGLLREAIPESVEEEALPAEPQKQVLQPDVPLSFRQLSRTPINSSP